MILLHRPLYAVSQMCQIKSLYVSHRVVSALGRAVTPTRIVDVEPSLGCEANVHVLLVRRVVGVEHQIGVGAGHVPGTPLVDICPVAVLLMVVGVVVGMALGVWTGRASGKELRSPQRHRSVG